MSVLDWSIVVVYSFALLGVGFYFYNKTKNVEDYFVGGRNLSTFHVGLSVVATDVGGGFSIGLAGLGFSMGLSGSWLLFTGLLGAWLSAVFLIPKVKEIEKTARFLTFPQFFTHFYGERAGVIAAIISAVGYLGFTSAQILAGAKLASGVFVHANLLTLIIIFGVISTLYTALGGIKAVIYTDSIQWIVLLTGLSFCAIPFGLSAVGGIDGVVKNLPPAHLSLFEISPSTFINWLITIVPIWFVAMTLYQRIYASRTEKEAKRAWYFAGVLEWPIMAFIGTTLGLIARAAFETNLFAQLGYPAGSALDPEMSVPLFLGSILPSGILGLVMISYISAVLSTADSCLMACSGNVVTDLLSKFFKIKNEVTASHVATFTLGVIAIVLSAFLTSVLDMMLYSYSFMISGLFAPIIFALFGRKTSSRVVISSMLAGGSTTVSLNLLGIPLPFGLDPNFFGIIVSCVILFLPFKTRK